MVGVVLIFKMVRSWTVEIFVFHAIKSLTKTKKTLQKMYLTKKDPYEKLPGQRILLEESLITVKVSEARALLTWCCDNVLHINYLQILTRLLHLE